MHSVSPVPPIRLQVQEPPTVTRQTGRTVRLQLADARELSSRVDPAELSGRTLYEIDDAGIVWLAKERG